MDWWGWEDPSLANAVVDLAETSGWEALFPWSGVKLPRPLERCYEVLAQHHPTTAVIETRYMDIDYRSEFSAFYSRAFAPFPNSARRIHFFRGEGIRAETLSQIPDDVTYLGYIVLRPSLLAPVCRALISPPPNTEERVRTRVTDVVTLFGQRFSVEGAPFRQQDTQLGRCAHACAWMVHYTHVLRGLAVRRQASDFSLQVDSSLALGRPLPADQGLNVQQLQELFRLFDLPACVYDVRDLPQTLEWLPQDPAGPRHLWTTITRASRHDHPGNWDRRIYPTVCRFLNSGFPVIVTTRTHAFVLVGYYRTVQGNGRPDRITFIRNDDAAGPYIEVPDVFDDVDAGRRHTPWDCLIVPLPPKLWLLCEAAEAEGGTVLRSFLKNARTCDVAACDELVRRMDARRLALRTYATASNSYKLGLVERDIDPVVLREYRLARLPRYIWVVEAIDCELREKHEPSTVGEVLLDATSSSLYPTTLAVHIAGGVRVYDPSQAEAGTSPPDPRPTPIDEGPMGAPEGPSAASLAGESAPDAHELLRCGAKAYVTGAPGIHPARR